MIQMTTPILPSHHDAELAQKLSAKLERGITVLLGDLPKPVLVLVRQILEYMAEGHAVLLSVLPDELSTQEAATVLGVSRPFVVKLMNRGVLAYRKVGTHYRIRLEDAVNYKKSNAVKALRSYSG
jgi:excisionase family DNA binding protein